VSVTVILAKMALGSDASRSSSVWEEDGMGDTRLAVEQHASGVWLISLSGEHDLSTVPDLRRALDEVFRHGTRILVDLTGATFIDSTVIGALVDAQRRCNDNPDESLVVVAPPSGRPAEVLNLVGMGDVFQIAPSRDAALTSLAS
jgi:anti-sigma B factor antagonist